MNSICIVRLSNLLKELTGIGVNLSDISDEDENGVFSSLLSLARNNVRAIISERDEALSSVHRQLIEDMQALLLKYENRD